MKSTSQVLLILCVMILVLALWKQHSELQQIKKENAQLLQQKTPHAVEQPEQPAKDKEIIQPEKTATTDEALVPTPTGLAPNPRTSGLTLIGTPVTPIANGYQTILQFNPITTEPLGVVAIVIRLPKNDDSKIFDLAPVGSAPFSDVSKNISEDGKFAVFQGTLETASSVEFALSVFGEAVADVRGTCGIGPYELTIGPQGASARSK